MFLSIAFLLAAADVSPGAAIVVSRRTNLSAAEVEAVARDVTEALRKADVPIEVDANAAVTQLAKLGVKDPAACAGKKACIAELGTQLGVKWVVAVSVSQIDVDRSVAVELLRVSDQTIVERDGVILSARAKVTRALLTRFAERARVAMAPATVLKSPDVPVLAEPPVLTPTLVATSPPPPPPPEPQHKAHTVSWVLGGAGAAGVVLGVVLLVVGLGSRAKLSEGAVGTDGLVYSPLTGSAALARNRAANFELAGAGAAAAVGLGLGTAAVVTW